MTIPSHYHSVSDICKQYHLSTDDFLDILINENIKLCIYMANLKTYYFDFKMINREIDEYDVQSYFLSGLFYLTRYEACKILHKGEADIFRIQPKGKAFITLAHPHRTLVSDLLMDEKSIHLLQKALSDYTITEPALNTLSV